MKKLIAFVLAVGMSASMFCLPASASFRRGETKVWTPCKEYNAKEDFHSPNVTLRLAAAGLITEAQMDAALLNAEAGIVPQGSLLRAGRMGRLEQADVSAPEANWPIQLTFTVEEADYLSLAVFFRAEGKTEWTLVSANVVGPLVECELPCNGTYAVAWGW